MSLRDEILAASDGRRELAKIERWPGDVWVHSVSAADRELWESSLQMVDGIPQVHGARCTFLVKCLRDSEGHRIFDDIDSSALAKKDSLIIDQLWEIANRVNTITESEVEEQVGN